MSTVENTSVVNEVKMTLHRRIAEIMQEKGDSFSIRAFSSRLGMSRETLRLIVTGERPVTPSELERIAAGLGLSVERLKKMDTLYKEQEVDLVLHATKRTKVMLMRALDFAEELVAVSKGGTERGSNLLRLGRIQYFLQQYDEAHHSFQSALKYAEIINEQFGEAYLLHRSTGLLMLTHTIRKEYSNVEHMIQLMETVFHLNPEKMGYVYYTRMKWNEHKGNIRLAKENAYTALDWFKQTCDMEQIGKAMINVAHFEYCTKNYEESARVLNSAIKILEPFDFSLLFAVKEYTKTLLRLGDAVAAIKLIEEYSYLANDYPDLRGKIQIMYTHAKNDPQYAARISEDPSISAGVRSLACKNLMQFFSLKDDASSVMFYYKKGRMISNKSEFFDEEEI